MSNMSGAGLAQLVQEIKLASENIRKADDESRERLKSIEASVNDLTANYAPSATEIQAAMRARQGLKALLMRSGKSIASSPNFGKR